MEELRSSAWTEFQENIDAVCRTPQNALEVTTISTGSPEGLTYVRSEPGVEEAANVFDRPLGWPHAASPQATLRLVRILRAAPDSPLLAISPDTLQRLARSPAASFDPASIWLLVHKYDGFHRFPAGSNPSHNETFFFGSALFCALWSYDPRARSTFALLLCRASSQATVRYVDTALTQYQAYIFAPTMLGYVLSMAVFMRIEKLSQEHTQLQEIERATGFAYEGRPQVPARHDVGQLTGWLQGTGQVVINAVRCKRDLRLISDVLDYMMIRDEACGSTGSAATPAEAWAENRSRGRTIALLQAVPLLLGRIRAHDNYVDYLKLRAERLSTTLFALLTHEDAAISVELADASRALAAAARRDSSAMKTMAVMTMAFLPGTFLAALFALPSLDWTGDPSNGVIRPKHWVYWAFTLPATVLVFLVWLILNNRRALICFVSKRMLDRGPRTQPGAVVPDNVGLENLPDLGMDMEPLGRRRHGR